MKSAVSLLALVLLLLLMPGGNLVSLDTPFPGVGNGGLTGGGVPGDNGDDHPFGGENESGRDPNLYGRNGLKVTFGIPVLDIFWHLPVLDSYLESRTFWLSSSSPAPATPQAGETEQTSTITDQPVIDNRRAGM